jgi:hypothetical protein
VSTSDRATSLSRVYDASVNVRRGGIAAAASSAANGVGARSGAAAGAGAACAVSMTTLVRGGQVIATHLALVPAHFEAAERMLCPVNVAQEGHDVAVEHHLRHRLRRGAKRGHEQTTGSKRSLLVT